MSTLNCLVTLSVLFAPVEKAKPVELMVKEWVNAPDIRIPEDREYVLLFFSTLERKKDIEPLIRELHKLSKRNDVAVIALSPAPANRVREFVKEHDIRFAAGAKAQTHRRLKVKRFPTVIRIQRSAGEIEQAVLDLSWEALAEWAEQTAQGEPTQNALAGDDTPIAELQRIAGEVGTDAETRKRALELMRQRVASEEFLPFCDNLLEQLDAPEHMTDRGEIAYQKHLADPDQPLKIHRFPTSSIAKKAMVESPDDPRWEPVRRFDENSESADLAQLEDAYFASLSDSLADALVRKEVARQLNRFAESSDAESRLAARGTLMQMLPAESDSGVKVFMINGIWGASRPGDYEVADFLEQRLQVEPDMRVVRPVLEVVIRCLRTGDGPCYDE